MENQLNLKDIKRDIYGDMLKWKESLMHHKTSLEIDGPRQVGENFYCA